MINRLTRNRMKRFRKKFFCEIWGEFIAKKKLNRTVTRYLQAFDYNYRLYCNAKLELYLKNFYNKGKNLKKRFNLRHNKLALGKTGTPAHRVASRELFWENFYSYYSSKVYGNYQYLHYDQGFLQSLVLRRWIFYRRRRYHFTKLKRWKKYYPRVFPQKFIYKHRDEIVITQLRYFYLCFNKRYFKKQHKISTDIIKLEHTLGAFVFRLNLVYNMFQSRKLINLGYVTINGKRVYNYSHKLVVGDMVSFNKELLKTIFFFLKKRGAGILNIPNYVLADYKTLSFLIWRGIDAKDVAVPINVETNWPHVT